MGKTTDDEPETVTTAGFKYMNEEAARIDKEGTLECRRCGFTHTLQECIDYRLAVANRELEKLRRFLNRHPEIHPLTGESPIESILRGYQQLWASLVEAKPNPDDTEVTELLKEE